MVSIRPAKPRSVVAGSYAAHVNGQDDRPSPARTYPLTAGVLRGRLFLSSYAPFFAILAARTAPGIGDRDQPLWPFLVSLAFTAVGFGDGWWLIRAATRRSAIRVIPLHVEEQGAAVAGYMPTYLLPFIGLAPNTVGAWIGYGIYIVVIFVVFLGSDFALVNPTLYVLGYRVARVTRELLPIHAGGPTQEQQVLVVAKHLPRPGQAINLTQLSGCWVQKET